MPRESLRLSSEYLRHCTFLLCRAVFKDQTYLGQLNLSLVMYIWIPVLLVKPLIVITHIYYFLSDLAQLNVYQK
jgi:hypothetical protein